MSEPAGLLLTHGAGGGADHHTLIALEESLSLPVRRLTFPYREEGRRAPDRANKLVPFIVEEARRFAESIGCAESDLVLGGRSMGGRMCSMAVSEGLAGCGLLMLSYPLHPSGKPDKLRVDHFPDILVPVLFISGDRDPFGTPQEFDEHLGAIAAPVEVCWLEGERHEPKSADDRIVEVTAAWLSGLGGG